MSPILILAALVTVYIVLGIPLRKLQFIRSPFSPRSRPAGRRCDSARCFSAPRNLASIALIGINPALGIVRKTPHDRIDFALEAEASRKGRRRSMPSNRSLPASFPPHHDDYPWPRCLVACRSRSAVASALILRRPLGMHFVGGLILSNC